MNNISLMAALERATTWSSYLDSQLSGAITLTNAETDPERTRICIEQAAHAAAQVANALAEYVLTLEHLNRQPPALKSGDAVQLDEEGSR